MMRIRGVAVLAALSLASATTLWSDAAHAQCASLSTAGTASTENFDSLSSMVASGVAWTDNTTVPNWYSTRATYNVATGSSNAGALYSFGVVGTNAVTDRALGGIASGGTVTFYWAGCFTNNTGAALDSVDIAYIGEQWRDGGNATNVAQQLTFQYQVADAGVITDADTPTTGWLNVATLDFASPIFTTTAAALDGNAVANRTAKSANIPVSVAVGQQIWIRWQDINEAGNDHGLAIDDVSVTGVAVPVAASADLTVTLMDNPDPVVAGANITYLATLTNNGPDGADDANVSLPLPATLTLVSVASSAGATCTSPAVGANGTVSCTWAGATAAGAGNARTVTVVAGVPANTASGTVFNAQTTVSSTTADPTAANDVATTGTGVITAADLSTALTGSPDPVIAGNSLTYVATLTNAGPSDAQNAAISLPLPAGTGFVSADPGIGGTCTTPAVGASGTISCSWTGATAAAARVLSAVASVPASATGTLGATATASSSSPDSNAANNTAMVSTAVVGAADLALTFTSSPAQVSPGLGITFAASAINNGPSDTQNVQISVVLNAGVQFFSVSASAGGTCTSPTLGSSGAVTCTFAGATAPAGTRSVTVTAYSYRNGSVGANASTSSATNDPTPANNSASSNVVVGGSGGGAPVMIPTADHAVLALLATLLGLLGFAAVRRRN